MINTDEIMTMLAKVQGSIDELTKTATTDNKVEINLYQQLHMIKQALQQMQIIKGCF